MNKIATGQRIKKIRIDRKETLEQFANHIKEKTDNTIKTTKSNVSKWEKGLNIPNDITLQAIAELGNVTIDYLLYGNKQEDDERITFFNNVIILVNYYANSKDSNIIETLNKLQDQAIEVFINNKSIDTISDDLIYFYETELKKLNDVIDRDRLITLKNPNFYNIDIKGYSFGKIGITNVRTSYLMISFSNDKKTETTGIIKSTIFNPTIINKSDSLISFNCDINFNLVDNYEIDLLRKSKRFTSLFKEIEDDSSFDQANFNKSIYDMSTKFRKSLAESICKRLIGQIFPKQNIMLDGGGAFEYSYTIDWMQDLLLEIHKKLDGKIYLDNLVENNKSIFKPK